MSNDIAVGVTSTPTIGVITKKPPHLVVVESPEGKSKQVVRLFLSLDKPSPDVGYITVKGFFVDKDEKEISDNFIEIITNNSKENIEEIMFPNHRVVRIKNLVFKAK